MNLTEIKLNKLNAQMSDIFGYTANTTNSLKNFNAMLSKTKSVANSNTVVVGIGDSILEGFYSAGGNTNLFRTRGWFGRLRTIFQKKYGDSGLGFYPSYAPTSTPYMTFGGTWDDITNFGCGGDAKHTVANGATASFSFYGTGCNLAVTKTTDSGKINVSIDGGGNTQYDLSNGTTINAFLLSIATGLNAGTHTVLITTVIVSQQVILLGHAPTKGNKGVTFHMCAKHASIISASATEAAMNAEIDIWQPNLTIIASTANDFSNQTPLDQYTASIQTIITRAKLYGDVLLIGNGLRNITGAIPQTAYVQALQNLATLNNCAFIDTNSLLGGTWAIANANGLMFDAVHQTDAGHELIAKNIAKFLMIDKATGDDSFLNSVNTRTLSIPVEALASGTSIASRIIFYMPGFSSEGFKITIQEVAIYAWGVSSGIDNTNTVTFVLKNPSLTANIVSQVFNLTNVFPNNGAGFPISVASPVVVSRSALQIDVTKVGTASTAPFLLQITYTLENA